jgi:FG-GAP-like repeat
MAKEKVRGPSHYAPAIWVIAAVFVSSAGAQESYRTQQSLRPAVKLSQRQKGSTKQEAEAPAPAGVGGRFLGWRMAAKKGPEVIRYFLDLEQHSKRPRGAGLSLRAGLRPAENVHRVQSNSLVSSSTPSVLPGVFLRVSLPAGALPSSIVTGDFNGDGKLDWVVANAGDNSLDLYLGNGDGTAQLPVIIQVLGESPVGVAAADLNGDGKLDLVVAESDSQTIGVLFGNGDGTFQPEVQIALPVAPLAVAIADLNRDGHPDLLVGIAGNDTENTYLAALLNNGSGQFGSPIYAPNPTPDDIVEADEFSVADVNGDGIPDVLVTGANAEGTIVQIYLGKGDGTLTPGEVVDQSNNAPLERDVLNAVLGDVNGDGCPDAVDVDTYAGIYVYLGDCKGNFDNTTHYEVYGAGDIGFGLAVADINGDGHPDLIVGGIPGGPGGGYGTETGDTVTVRFNDGTGHFGTAQVYRGEAGMFSLVVADLKGSGYSDIITANQNANSTTVYANNGSGDFGQPEGGYDGFEEGTSISPFNAPDSGFVVADINGDGKPDLGLVEYGEGAASNLNITVMLNQGNGQFSPPIRSPAISGNPGLRIADFVFADFRKTGQLDFLAEVFDDSGSSSPQLLYSKNMGNGQFGTPVPIFFNTPGDYGFGAICVGDFNKDGNLDFAVATGTGPAATPSQLTVYLGHGDGTFTQSFQVDFGSQLGNISPYPEAVFVGDANGDGKPDVFVWLYDNTFGPGAPGGRDLFEFLGNGDGTFQAPRDLLQDLSAMTMVDLNHDGRLDVIDIESGSTVVAEGEPGTAPAQVNIYLGQPDGTFGSPTTYTPYSGIFDAYSGNNVTEETDGVLAAYVGDFTGDGSADVAVIQFDSLAVGPAHVQFLMGNGDGTFTPTYDVFRLGIRQAPDLTAPNLLGDGRTAFLQTPNYTASYHVLPAANAPSFQIQPLETPVLGGSDSLAISLDLPSASDTVVSLSASDSGIQIPSSAAIPAGQLAVEVPFTLGSSVMQNRWFSITAEANGETQIAYDFPGTAIDSFTQVVVPPPVDTVQAGGISELWSAGVQSNGDASGTFQTSCEGLPAGMSCQFQDGLDTFTVAGGGFQNVVFQISVSSTSTPGGTYPFNVVSTDGQTTLEAPETIQVTAPPPPAPGVALSPTSVSFPIALVGTAQMQTVQLTNNGNATLDITGITIQSGANNFTESNTCGSSLAASTACTITVTLNTASVGSLSGSLAVADNAAGSPQTVPLSGSVGDLAIQAAAGGGTTITVPAGTPAVFSLQVAPNNYTGAVEIGCSGTIPQGTCTVQPSSITLNGSSAVGFQVTVTSTATTGTGLVAPTSPQSKLRLPLLLALVFLIVTTLLTTSFERSLEQRARCCLIFGLLLAGTFLLGSCGGGSGGIGTGGGGGNPGTPQGSYVFTVTASAGGGTRSLQVTAVVQ